MLYVNDQDLRSRPIDWHSLAKTMLETLRLIDQDEYRQPVKPYLKFNHPQNRIISMPAYLGGSFNKAGIKWIASFPDNASLGLPRAHSVIVLNNASTGRPEAILNSPLPSIARTASISGLMVRSFLESRSINSIRLGIIGWGPIGQHHAQMASALFGSKLDSLHIFDLRKIDITTIPLELRKKQSSPIVGTMFIRNRIFLLLAPCRKRDISIVFPPKVPCCSTFPYEITNRSLLHNLKL